MDRSTGKPHVDAEELAPGTRESPVLSVFLWVLLANLFRQASFLVVNAVLFVRLSRSTFGALALASGYMTVFAGLGEFGIRQIGWREIARHPRDLRTYTGPFLCAKTVTATGAIVLYLLLMPLLWQVGAPRWIYLLYGMGILLNGSTFDFPFFGLNRVDLVAKYSLLSFSLYLVGCVFLVTHDGRALLVPTFFATSMAILFILQVNWLLTRHGTFRLRLSVAEFRGILSDSWPLGVGETLNRLSLSYPLILIGMTIGSEGVGDYRIAELGYSFLAQFGHMFAAAGFSRLSHMFQHRRSEFSSSFTRMLLFTVVGGAVAGALFTALGPRAFRLVFADAADETLAVVRVLGIALVFAAPARLLKGLLASIDRQEVLVPVNAIGMIVGASVGWLGIQTHGIVGMAAGALMAELCALLLLLSVYWKRIEIPS